MPRSAEPEHDVAETLRSFVAGPVAERLIEAGGEILEERRLITALFADVSGFTSLAERLDPEQLLEVIDPVIAGLSSIVGRYEGYVEKFAGDALLALFGAPVTHEDDAARRSSSPSRCTPSWSDSGASSREVELTCTSASPPGTGSPAFSAVRRGWTTPCSAIP